MSDFGWFEKLLTVSGTYLPNIKKDVQTLLAEYDLKSGGGQPKKYMAYKLSSKLIKRAAFKTAGIGGLTSVPAVLPLVGTAGTVLVGSAVDLYYLLSIQIELCYAVSAAYEVAMDEEELKAVTLAILGFSGSAEALKVMAAGAMRRAINEMAQGYLRTGLTKATSEVAERLIPRLLRGTFKFLPFLGIPLSASINIASTLMVGNQARRYFAVWSDRELCLDDVKGLMMGNNDAL
ncbi:MAG: hypothetical protein HQL08_08305 [Nitrospirae bacterium]|nr:hypothetical protein [Nitrospirota bacterium]